VLPLAAESKNMTFFVGDGGLKQYSIVINDARNKLHIYIYNIYDTVKAKAYCPGTIL